MFQDVKVELPITNAIGGAQSSKWINMANYRKALFIITIDQNNAATTAITVDKAKTSAGGSNSDGITIQNWWSMADVAGTTQAAASDTFTKGTAGTSITTSATGTGASQYVLEFDSSELGDGYNFLQVELGASHNDNFVSCVAILSEPRFASAANPTALA